MRDRLWVLFGLLAGISFAVQVALPIDLSESPETSFETAPRGHAALFELLMRFDSVKGRWVSGLSMPAVTDTVWWIAAPGMCDSVTYVAHVDRSAGAESEVDGEESDEPGERDAPFRWTTESWIESGGTAVVWLSYPPMDAEEEVDPYDTEPEPETREVAFVSPLSGSASRRSGESESDPNSRDVPDGEDAARDEDIDEEEDAEDAESTRDAWNQALDETRKEMREGEPRPCRSIAGYALPNRRLSGLEGGELPRDADHIATAFSVGRWVESREDFDYDAARILPGVTLAFFEGDSDALDGWQPLWVEADDFSPFALERRIGEGRLIVAADARVLTNARLGRVDSAPFVFDWIADWGKPWIDEHRHGVVPEAGTFRYLAGSPAWAACVGLLALGGLVIWRGHAMPKRRVEEVDPEAPTLAEFVDSLAHLYATTGDHARAFERYRALSLDRVRRALGLAPGTPEETLLATLRARAENRPALRERGIRDILVEDLRIGSAAELQRAAARLDSLVDVLREEGGSADAARRRKT